MASVTRNSDENRARSDADAAKDKPELPDESDLRDDGGDDDEGGRGGKGAKAYKSGKGDDGATAAGDRKPGRSYFTVYKKGQGYWTRMGTLIATTVLGLMLAYTLYDKI